MKENKISNQTIIPNQELEIGLELNAEKISNKLQDEYLSIIEKRLIESRNNESPYDKKLSNNEKILESIFEGGGKPPSFIERERVSKNVSIEEQRASEKIWIVIDFDDVINKTTTYNNFLKEKICRNIGLDEKEFERLYNESKIINNEGKKVFRFNIFKEKIKIMNPGKEELIDNLFAEGINQDDFIDKGVKRALMLLGDSSRKKEKDTRISILTFGDINYQKGRIDKTGISDVVDDIVYTEGSKREVLETILEKDYKNKGIIPPIVITLDDSKEQIKDYSNVNLNNNFINMHYMNSQGKKSMEKSHVEQVVAITEKELNEAALDFYRICTVCLTQNMRLSREELHKAFNDKDIGNVYHTKGMPIIGRKVARRIDSKGFTNSIKFGDTDYSNEDPEMSKVIDKDGFTELDYYMSLKDPVYRASQSNIKYSKDTNNRLFRDYDVCLLQKNKDGGLEKALGHKKDEVFLDRIKNKEIIQIFSVEEFIKNSH